MRKGRGEVKRISDLFDTYKKRLRAPQKTVVDTFRDVAYELLSVKIDAKKVRYSPATRTLSLSGGGPLKSEIVLHKDEILAHMKGRLGEQNAPKEIL